jgi:hypothetical protein
MILKTRFHSLYAPIILPHPYRPLTPPIKQHYKAITVAIKAAKPRSEETATEGAPEAGAIGTSEGPGELVSPPVVMFAQAMRPPEALWITIDLLPRKAPIPGLVEM